MTASENLSPRERQIYSKLWEVYHRKVVPSDSSREFFNSFIENQKNFSRDWLVHVYD